MLKTSLNVLFILAIPAVTLAAFGDTTTYVGQLKYGDGGYRTDAYFDFPEDIVSDGAGSFYLADTFNGVIRKINSNGVVSTVVGAGGYGDTTGSGSSTKFALPAAVGLDSSGNVYIADTGNGKIKKFNGSTVSTIASDFDRPEGLVVRSNKVYVTDYTQGTLTVMNTDGSSKRTITSSLSGPKKLYVRTSSDYAYVANSLDYTIVRVNLSSGSISEIAGVEGDSGKNNGSCENAHFKNLWGLTVVEGDSVAEDDIYVTDGTGDPGNITDRNISIQNTADAGKIRVIDQNGSDVPEDLGDTDEVVIVDPGSCTTYLAFKDSDEFTFNYPNSLTRYGNNLYIAVTGISEVVRLSLSDFTDAEHWAGRDRFHNRNGKNGLPGRPKDVVVTKDRSKVFYTENNKVKYISTSDRKVHKLVGSTIDNYQENDDRAYVGTEGRFSDTLSLDISPDGKTVYVIDRNNNRIREVNVKARSVSYLTGAGDVNVGGGFDNGYQEGEACPNQFGQSRKNCAYFSRPGGIAVDSNGKYAYVADTGNEVIRRVTLYGKNKGKTKLIAGSPQESGYQDATRKDAQFNVPIAVTIDNADNYLYVADRDNHTIRQVRISDGQVTTLVGNPSKKGYLDGKFAEAYLNLPVEVFYNRGNVYFSEAGTHMVRVADRGDEAVKLVAGDGNRGYNNGDRDNTQFDNPVGLARKGDNLLIADSLNDLIRKVDLGDGENIPYTEDAPAVSGVSPSSNTAATSSSETKALRITGINFRHGATVFFDNYEANATYVNSSNELSVVIPFGQMPRGSYDVTVENSDGQRGTKDNAYTIL
ncbi:MAG: NHL repeat containing protein [uncultured bacterium]|nr:MAG: NHL repeat containing protein [uncultured bacterium]